MADPDTYRVRTLAVLSIGRGCFFAALAIFCVMIGLIAEPLQSLKSGAILTMIVTCVLLIKAEWVVRHSYKQTELWILLDRRIDLTPEVAQRIITVTLREVYLRYALYATAIAVGFWLMALLLWLGSAKAGFK